MRGLALSLCLAITIVPWMTASANETHIFFGTHRSEIADEWRGGSGVPIQCGEGYYIAGDLARGTTVSFSGDEVDFQDDGVYLSKGTRFQLGGGRGSITIDYPSGVGIIEVIFTDESAILVHNGCDLTAFADGLKTLNAQLGGELGKLGVLVCQQFQPSFSGQGAGLRTVITLDAAGYDEFLVKRISLYSTYPLASNTTFLDGARGRKSAIMDIPFRWPDNVRFANWVVNPLRAGYHPSQGERPQADMPDTRRHSPETTKEPSEAVTGASLEPLYERTGDFEAYGSAAFSPDGSLLAISGGGRQPSDCQKVVVLRVGSWASVSNLQADAVGVDHVAFSPDGRLLVGNCLKEKDIKMWSVSGWKQAGVLGEEGKPKGITFSPDGRLLASTGWSSDRVTLWSVQTFAPIARLEDLNVGTLAFSPDGSALAVQLAGGSVNFFEVSDIGFGQDMKQLSSAGYFLAFSPDGRFLACASTDGDHNIKIYDVARSTLLTSALGHKDGTYAIAFSPNGSVLASGGIDGALRLWSTSDWRLLAEVPCKGLTVTAIVFSPDGLLMASINEWRKEGNGSCDIWRVKYGEAQYAQTTESGPDLTVSRIWFEGNATDPARSRIGFTVLNSGDQRASSEWASKLTVDDGEPVLVGVDKPEYTSEVYSLGPGEEITLYNNEPLSVTPGSHVARVMVDWKNEIEETDEDNNASSMEFQITEENASKTETKEPYSLVWQAGRWGTSGEDCLFYPGSIAVDAGGHVYVCNEGSNPMNKYGPDGDVIGVLGTVGGEGEGHLFHPRCVAADKSGNIYVSQEAYDGIQKLSSDGTFIAKWEGRACGIALDGFGNVYVGDCATSDRSAYTSQNGVREFASGGSIIAEWRGVKGRVLGDPSGNIFVLSGSDVRMLTPSGGVADYAHLPFEYVSALALDASGDVFVPAQGSNEILKLSPRGDVIARWELKYGSNRRTMSEEIENHRQNSPNKPAKAQVPGIAVDASGNVYVTLEWANEITCVQKYSPTR
jgi:WD40 repeat protein